MVTVVGIQTAGPSIPPPAAAPKPTDAPPDKRPELPAIASPFPVISSFFMVFGQGIYSHIQQAWPQNSHCKWYPPNPSMH